MAQDTVGIFRDRVRNVAKLERAGMIDRARNAARAAGQFATRNRIPANVQRAEWARARGDSPR